MQDGFLFLNLEDKKSFIYINMEKENLVIPAEFADICPISDKDFHNEMSILVEKPMFQQVVKFVSIHPMNGAIILPVRQKQSNNRFSLFLNKNYG